MPQMHKVTVCVNEEDVLKRVGLLNAAIFRVLSGATGPSGSSSPTSGRCGFLRTVRGVFAWGLATGERKSLRCGRFLGICAGWR
jgi:hypothetical protein